MNPQDHPAEPFDQLAEDGITAYAEALAEQIAPDDPAKQALIVEGLRALSGRARGAPLDVRAMSRTMLSQIQPGAGSGRRFFGKQEPGGQELHEVWDFFQLFESAVKINIYRDGGAAVMTRTGDTIQLDATTSTAFNNFLIDAYGLSYQGAPAPDAPTPGQKS
jgi:hypothetical protein